MLQNFPCSLVGRKRGAVPRKSCVFVATLGALASVCEAGPSYTAFLNRFMTPKPEILNLNWA